MLANFGLLMLLQGLGPYSTSIKKVEKEIKEMAKKINDLCGEDFLMFFWLIDGDGELETSLLMCCTLHCL
jgi:hypothetical protein